MSKECLPWKIQTSSLGQRAVPIKSLRAMPLEDFDWNGLFALGMSVWSLQGKHSLLIGSLQSMSSKKIFSSLCLFIGSFNKKIMQFVSDFTPVCKYFDTTYFIISMVSKILSHFDCI